MWDLDLMIPQRPAKKKNGTWAKGHTPFNKGRKWDEWMPTEGREKAKAQLELGRHCGNWRIAQEARKIAIAGVSKEGRVVFFDSASDAQNKTGICAMNIRSCCKKKRKNAGGCQWFYTDDTDLRQYL